MNVEHKIWIARALAMLGTLPKEWRGTGEDIRALVTREVGVPHNSNVWGALVTLALKRRVIRATGEERKMRKPSSHGRSTPVYASCQ